MKNQNPGTKDHKRSSDDDVEVGGNVSDSVIVHGDGNVINVIEAAAPSGAPRRKTNPHKKRPSGKKNVAIIVALIGLFGTITAALISAYGNSDSATPTPVIVASVAFTETIVPTAISTDTVLPDMPTTTPVTATDTPVPTYTSVPPVALGEDWKAGCISSLWKPYPSSIQPVERGDGCWREPLHVFSAENGDLDFLAERVRGPAEIYGLFAPLPEKGTVTFTVRLRDLNNVDLWMGIFVEPDVASQGLLMTILNGDVSRRSVVQKDPFTYETIQGTVALNQGNGYSISFTFTNLSARSQVNPSVFVTNHVSLPVTQKWLFLGYKGLSGEYRIEGTFLSFELKP